MMELKHVHEMESNRLNLFRQSSFKLALISIFSALSVVVGYVLVYIPNIEMFTLFIFLSGFTLGRKDGSIVGILSSFIFVFFNPLGASPLPLLSYQIFHYSMVGFSGGIVRNYLDKRKSLENDEDYYSIKNMIIFGTCGAIITFIYDIFSTYIGGIIVSIKIEYFIASYLSGMIFTTVHLIGNTLGFVFIFPGLAQLTISLLEQD
ncbi:MAG: hypothetical protein ACTSRH_03475 [Promethearchaeota archaeon]